MYDYFIKFLKFNNLFIVEINIKLVCKEMKIEKQKVQ